MSEKRSLAADSFTRGIELVKQQTRTQLRSVLSFLLILSVTSIGLWLVYVLAFSASIELEGALKWALASFQVDALSKPGAAIRISTSAGSEIWTAQTVVSHPWFLDTVATLKQRFVDGIYAALATTFGLGVVATVELSRRGRAAHRDEIVRGPTAVGGKELTRIVAKRGDASRLKVGDVTLLRSAETQHLLLMGTTGVGKSQALYRMMDAIATSREAAVIYDRTGEMIAKYFDPSRGDIILNPFDARSPPWSPFAEIKTISDPERLSSAFIPAGQGDGAFFNEAARALLTALFMRIGKQSDRSVLLLLQAALQWPLEAKRQLLAGTEAAKFYNDDSRAGHDIDMIMSTYTRSLRYLPVTSGTDNDFSIRAHIENLDAYQGRKPGCFSLARPRTWMRSGPC